MKDDFEKKMDKAFEAAYNQLQQNIDRDSLPKKFRLLEKSEIQTGTPNPQTGGGWNPNKSRQSIATGAPAPSMNVNINPANRAKKMLNRNRVNFYTFTQLSGIELRITPEELLHRITKLVKARRIDLNAASALERACQHGDPIPEVLLRKIFEN